MKEIRVKEFCKGKQGIELIGDGEVIIRRVVSLKESTGIIHGGFVWVKPGNEDQVTPGLDVAAAALTKASYEILKGKLSAVAYLITETPRAIFQRFTTLLAPDAPEGTEPSACVHPSASVGDGVYIGHNVVIEAQVLIGKRVQIGHNTVICEGTVLEDDAEIGCNCTIGRTGFGYEKDDEGVYQRITHLGSVLIQRGAIIHNNTCIDRAVLGQTLIGANVRIDNLVHIAHGVQIGRNSVVIANSMIAGSATIGTDTWIAPSVNILNQLTIGNRVQTGMAATIVKPVPDDTTVVGAPAEPIEQYKQWLAARKKLLAGS